MFDDYSRIVSEAKYKTKYGEGLRLLTSKQMLQRLPIAPAQVKAGNTSENLLNEIRKVIYSLYHLLYLLIIYYIQKNIKKSYKNNKPKISARTWNEKFELPDGSYSVSDI